MTSSRGQYFQVVVSLRAVLLVVRACERDLHVIVVVFDDKGQSQLQLFEDQLTGSKRKTSPTAADFAGFSLEAGVAMSALNRSGPRPACWPESREVYGAGGLIRSCGWSAYPRIRTCVHNRGSVISEAHLKRIWDRFFTTRADRGGTGLGLPIVATVIEAHGGPVTVSSTEEQGTTFCFDLPVRS